MKSELIEYKDGDKLLEGYLAYNSGKKGPQPAVIILHAFAGRNEFVCQKADLLAELGYAGFAADMYGKGVLGKSREENMSLMMPFINDRAYLQKRLLTTLEVVGSLQIVDKSRIAAMGYCFGGLCALDLARAGADIKGVISFHGALGAPEKLPKKPIKAKILALHGHDDPMVPPTEVSHFEKEMTQANVDWQVHVYGKTMHAFTAPDANDPDFGTVYNPIADRRSEIAMKNFFQEIFK